MYLLGKMSSPFILVLLLLVVACAGRFHLILIASVGSALDNAAPGINAPANKASLILTLSGSFLMRRYRSGMNFSPAMMTFG